MIRTLWGRASITLAMLLLFSFPMLAEDLSFASISPLSGKPLQVGSTVLFEIGLEYKIENAEYRRVQLEILRGGDGERAEVVSRWVQVLPKGKGTMTVKRTVAIPETSRIALEVFIPSGEVSMVRAKALAFQRKEFDVVDKAGKRIKARPTGRDSIAITSLSPSPELPLRQGDNVDFAAKINYDLRSANGGRILWFLTSNGEVQTILSSQVVAAGKGTLDLKKSVQLQFALGTQPAMFAFLMADGYVRSVAADTERYSLDQPPGNLLDATSRITVNVAGQRVDRVRIASISPSPDMSLRAGDTLDFEIGLEYDLASTDLAEMGIRFGSALRFLGQDDRVVSKGKGVATISRRMLIPEGTEGTFSVRVGFAPPATAEDIRRYRIAPK
jgi:hypothetical protein